MGSQANVLPIVGKLRILIIAEYDIMPIFSS